MAHRAMNKKTPGPVGRAGPGGSYQLTRAGAMCVPGAWAWAASRYPSGERRRGEGQPLPRWRSGAKDKLISLLGHKQGVNLLVGQLFLALLAVDHETVAAGRDPDDVVAEQENLLDLWV